MAALDLSAGGVVAARKRAREAARGYLAEIDAIARRMLGLAAVQTGTEASESETDEGEEEAETL